MNIIIIRNTRTAPWRIDFARRRNRLLAYSLATVGALLFVALGAASTLLVDHVRIRELSEVVAMRTQITTARAELEQIDGHSRHDLDALALQLGQLQAQATRLNALGDRLTQVGKLNDGEFNFSSDPALGGPEDALSGPREGLPLQDNIQRLRAEFDSQEAQLSVLENLLRDRKIDNNLVPSGRPVAEGYLSSGFGERADPIDGHAGMHLGLDFDAPLGSSVLAVADGVVTFAGERSGYGNVVEIDHGNGYMTRYAHNSEFVAQVGQPVHAGDTIAKVGSTGHSTGPHCHFEVWYNGHAVNPLVYVKTARANRA
ncbi:MAG: M23 family metallopeptidase [Rhodanobacter sp.]|jgi:murein DD-endopeptidase MepM/ murein hydrolase activator NlpD|nr:M23 family metallopeptidase [Rhodanobacter sp.]